MCVAARRLDWTSFLRGVGARARAVGVCGTRDGDTVERPSAYGRPGPVTQGAVSGPAGGLRAAMPKCARRAECILCSDAGCRMHGRARAASFEKGWSRGSGGSVCRRAAAVELERERERAVRYGTPSCRCQRPHVTYPLTDIRVALTAQCITAICTPVWMQSGHHLPRLPVRPEPVSSAVSCTYLSVSRLCSVRDSRL